MENHWARPLGGEPSPITRSVAAEGPGDHSDNAEHWIARELHDVVAQCLTTVLVELELLRRDGLPDRPLARVAALEEEVRDGLHEVRQLLYRLRGEPLDDEAFAETIAVLLLDFQRKTSIETRFTVSSDWPDGLASDTALHLRRITQEALNNVRMHSGARHVEVALAVSGRIPTLTISDDGVGQAAVGLADCGGLGIIGMRERAAILGARLHLESEPGRGTTVRVTLRARSGEMVGAA
jgi:two-component system sensor histidine kinase UhpB